MGSSIGASSGLSEDLTPHHLKMIETPQRPAMYFEMFAKLTNVKRRVVDRQRAAFNYPLRKNRVVEFRREHVTFSDRKHLGVHMPFISDDRRTT